MTVRPMIESDLAEADRVFRLAFGTFVGLADPMAFGGDSDYVRGRWATTPEAALTAELNGRLIGSNFATRWGSVGFFGPLTVDPARWDHGVGRSLLDATMSIMDGWGLIHTGLFTFPHSPKHLDLYQRYGFVPRFLTSVFSAPPRSTTPGTGWSVFSADHDQPGRLADCALLTDSVYPGLDLASEIQACREHNLGDTVLLDDRTAFAVCHLGAGTEAGSGTCYVKFAAAGPGDHGAFIRLLDACEAFALSRRATRLVAGVSTARRDAHRILTERGYRVDLIGIAMHKPDEPGYHRSDALVLDDWR